MRDKMKYTLTGLALLLAVMIRLFAMQKASETTIQPEAVKTDMSSSTLTDVEQIYVDKFLEKASKKRKLTPTDYDIERYTTSEVIITISFKETADTAIVRYDPWLDRWSGSITLKGE